ncbi:MAG: hypothetical protein OEY36_05625 [Gammaproteobacteria bacterium]|nr:hypothetical protein [Gammaproteobacteria bacterium]
MYVSAANSSINPYDIAREAGLRIRVKREQAESSANKATIQPQQERVVQGEVLSRQRIQTEDVSSTRDTLAHRRSDSQQSGLGYNARQAVNTYINNQYRAESAERQQDIDAGSLVDIYV